LRTDFCHFAFKDFARHGVDRDIRFLTHLHHHDIGLIHFDFRSDHDMSESVIRKLPFEFWMPGTT